MATTNERIRRLTPAEQAERKRVENIGKTQRLYWCRTHDDVAWRYADGSVSCRWELVVEDSTDDHVLVAVSRDVLGDWRVTLPLGGDDG